MAKRVEFAVCPAPELLVTLPEVCKMLYTEPYYSRKAQTQPAQSEKLMDNRCHTAD